MIMLVVTSLIAVFAIGSALWDAAFGHDWRRPDLDDWYGGLKRPGMITGFAGCCSKTDCHTTQAELRDGDWWARVGQPRGDGDWTLLDFVRVPAAVVLKHDNPTGEAVICHSLDWSAERIDPHTVVIWCFVPPMES
jgi:hypothetical protein